MFQQLAQIFVLILVLVSVIETVEDEDEDENDLARLAAAAPRRAFRP